MYPSISSHTLQMKICKWNIWPPLSPYLSSSSINATLVCCEICDLPQFSLAIRMHALTSTTMSNWFLLLLLFLFALILNINHCSISRAYEASKYRFYSLPCSASRVRAWSVSAHIKGSPMYSHCVQAYSPMWKSEGQKKNTKWPIKMIMWVLKTCTMFHYYI